VYDTTIWEVVGGPIAAGIHRRAWDEIHDHETELRHRDPDRWDRPSSVFVRGGQQILTAPSWSSLPDKEPAIWEAAPGQKKNATLPARHLSETAVFPGGIHVALMDSDGLRVWHW